MFNVAAAGEYDTETYLKVVLLLAVFDANCLVVGAAVFCAPGAREPQSGLLSADALPAGNGDAAVPIPVCGYSHALQRADRAPDQRLPEGAALLCLLKPASHNSKAGLTCIAAALQSKQCSGHINCWMARQMTDNAGLRAVISKAQVIDELENTLPGWVKRQHCMFPNYIHVLKARALPHCCASFQALMPPPCY